jgi:thiamine-phosphate pyrophosphorylase
VAAKIDLLQIREKQLRVNVLYKLSASAAKITRGSATRLLINDRSDVAFAVRAQGVHLTTQSLPADVVRRTFGDDFLIGVSTHSLEEAEIARRSGADFVVFGPVFSTPNKGQYGEPQGLRSLEKVASALSPFPVLALGGVMTNNVAECIRAGARGIAAIRMFNDPSGVRQVVSEIRAAFENG